MDRPEHQMTPPAGGAEAWWKIPSAIGLALIAVPVISIGVAPWTLFDSLSRSSISVFIILLLVFTSMLWIVSFFALPLWIAWLTDARSQSDAHHWHPLKPVNLDNARQAMEALQAELDLDRPAMHPTSTIVNSAIDSIITLIMRDFVATWHIPLLSGSPDGSSLLDTPTSKHFPGMVELTIRNSLSALIARASAVDIPKLGVCKVLPSLTMHMKLFEEAEMRWRGSGSAADITEGEDGDVFLAALYNAGHLHPAVASIVSPDTKLTELDYLRKVAVRVIKYTLPESEAKSKGVSIVVRELIASVILKQAVDALSEPDMLNALLEEKVGAALQEQKLVNKLREALDKQGSSKGATSSASRTLTTPSSSSSGTSTPRRKEDPRISASSYDTFMEEINSSKSILDARRTRNGLLNEIRKTKTSFTSEEGESKKRKQLNIYLQRLLAALEAVDRRMQQLGTSSSIQEQREAIPTVSLRELAQSITLRDVLTSPSALSYFLEYTESRKHSIFVQFWLSVGTFKNPLEVAESDSEDESHRDPSSNAGSQISSSLQMAREEEVKTLREDLIFFVDNYYQSHQLLSVLKQRYVDAAKEFVQKHDNGQLHATNRQVKIARRSVLKAQKQVYEEMVEEDWPSFQKSQRWHRMLEDLHRERAQDAPIMSLSPYTSSFAEDRILILESEHLERPSASRSVSHAHLFGLNSTSTLKSGPSANLFEKEEAEQNTGLRSPSLKTQSSLDQLMGGKGGTFDGVKGRKPLFREALFDEEDVPNGAEKDYDVEREAAVQVEKIDAIENVLESIIKEGLPTDQVRSKRPFQDSRPSFSKFDKSSKSNLKSDLLAMEPEQENQPSLASRETSPNLIQEAAFSSSVKDGPRTPINLRFELSRIDQAIKRLEDQEELLLALLRKAELTGSSAKEMRLLQKSQTTVARELRELKFERSAFSAQQQQEHQRLYNLVNIEPDKVKIQIQHANLSHDGDGKEYAIYLIEVNLFAERMLSENSGSERSGDGIADLAPQSGWVVSRRYNEFYALHNRLKDKYGPVRALDHVFPGKRLAGLVNATFVENRRVNLQKYLKELVKWEAVCKSFELKSFLSQSVQTFTTELLDEEEKRQESTLLGNNDAHPSASRSTTSSANPNLGLVSILYRGVTGVAEGLDDLLFGPSMFEIIVNRLSNGVVDLVGFNEMERILAGATTSSAAEIKEATQITNNQFTGPICDAIFELFQLKSEGNWFRRQAIVIVAQQALGGTIERKLRQSVSATLEPNALLTYATMVKNIMWPNGKLKQPEIKRTMEERRNRRENALKKLSTLIPSEFSFSEVEQAVSCDYVLLLKGEIHPNCQT